MNIAYGMATNEDIDCLYRLNKAMIDAYESSESIDYNRVLRWVRRKVETHIDEYAVVYADGEKAGYYRFYKNEDGEYEIDDLYILPEFQNRGIGSAVVKKCCFYVNASVMLYVFIRNESAVAFYKKHGFKIVKTVGDSRYIMKKDGRKYYEAYEERYKTAHACGVRWASDISTPIVMEVIEKYRVKRSARLLEIGCGEGRDAKTVLQNGYSLMSTDISSEAIAYCKRQMPQYASCFSVLDCLFDKLDAVFDFIFGVAVVHMLVLDEDRNRFYQFIRDHLTADGTALICTMGDGSFETQSDIDTAFTLQERNHESGKMMVAGTSCRMVSFRTFEDELARNGLDVIEKGLTASLPDFNSLMYAVVKKRSRPQRENS